MQAFPFFLLFIGACFCQEVDDLRSSLVAKPKPANGTGAQAELDDTSSEFDLTGPELSAEGLPTDCGVSYALHSRIVGGKPAKIGAWPWIAAIGYKSYDDEVEYQCGGTLISSTFVITASHCVYEMTNIFSVRLGEHNLQSDDDGVTPLDVEISETILHPKFDPNEMYNDIALLRLKDPVPFSPQISPACLPSTDALKNETFDDQNPFVIGWGRTNFNRAPSDILQEVQIPVVPVPECIKDFKVRLDVKIDDTQICAGLRRGGKDACQGDSGGPLLLTVGDQYILIGIVSYGYKCAEPGFPGIYARVTNYLDWIQKTIAA